MNVFEAEYPGNLSAVEGLISAIQTEGVVAFTGAGTSMPQLPSWYGLIQDLLQHVGQAGLIDGVTAAALKAEKNDLLFVADEVYKCAGETQIRIRVGEIFDRLKAATESHKAVVSTHFKKIITLNYDVGLEMAYASLYSTHLRSITARDKHEVHEWLGNTVTQTYPPILHWHGVASNIDSIVLSGSDYHTFYEVSNQNKDSLRMLFGRDRCVLIGFGFTDPFITSQLSSVMQTLPASNKHFAIIGVPNDGTFNCALERRKYVSKYKLEPIFYPLEEGTTDNKHSALQLILTSLRQRCPRSLPEDFQTPAKLAVLESSSQKSQSYRVNLFEIGGRKIYCEPNLWIEIDAAGGGSSTGTKITVSELVSGAYDCFISAPHEFGLTNLGLRLASELELSGISVLFQNASDLPNYKKKLLEHPKIEDLNQAENSTIIIDNYSPIENRRLLKEIRSALPNTRIIVLRRNWLGYDLSDDNSPEQTFKKVNLRGLARSDIRSIIYALSPGWNSDVTSTVVDKVYTDLLQLCIPLTPSNVIMYASVLCRDGTFVPVSRLHIVDRFISEALQRASDSYSESFNYINKVDVLSKFCYELFSEDVSSFDIPRWTAFCNRFKKENLVDFDHVELISDLASGRIVVHFGDQFYFKYRMFFSYFVGRRIAAVPEVLKECLEGNRHLELDGLVEVLCGTLSDCSDILRNILDKFEDSIQTFYKQYPLNGLDAHANATWEITDQEDAIWSSVFKRIEEGPTGTAQLDQLKTSLASERRTDDQKVCIIKFIVSEKSVSKTARLLETAIESAKSAKADVKIASVDAVVRGHVLAYEVATMLSPLIAMRKYVSWNGFTYINLIENDLADTSGTTRDRMLSRVLSALPTSIAGNASNIFGSRKLGQVFLAINVAGGRSPIYRFLILSLLLRSKPTGWIDAARTMIKSMGRNELYLRHYLSMTLTQLNTEVNTSSEVLQLKEFVAAIQLRRTLNVKSASKSQIKGALEKLDESEYFSGPQRSVGVTEESTD